MRSSRTPRPYKLAERTKVELSGKRIDLVAFDAKAAYDMAFTETQIGEINRHMATAREGFKQCLRMEPKNQQCHYGMGLVASSVKSSKHYNPKKARKYFAKADKLPEAHVALARMQRFDNDLEGAEAALRKALMLDSKHQRARVELGIVYKLDGRDKAAIKAFVKAFKINRMSADGKRALDELSVLEPQHPLIKEALTGGVVAGDVFSSERFQAAVAMLEERLGGVEPKAAEQRVLDQILARLLEAADASSDTRIRVRVLANEMPNALALPNGNIYVTRGLLDYIKKEWPDRPLTADHDVMGHIMAHEVSHVTQRHALQSVLIREAAENSWRGVDPGILTHVTRLQEIEADRVGIVMAFLAGYHPRGGIELLEARGQIEEIPQHLDHPTFEERVGYLEEYWSNDVKYAFVSFGLGLREMKKGDSASLSSPTTAAKYYRKAIKHFRRYRDTLQPTKLVLNNMGAAYARLGIYALGSKKSALHKWQTDFSVEKKAAIEYMSTSRWEADAEEERTRGKSKKRTPKSLRQAISLLREALKLDPEYARARENLAAVYIATGKYSAAKKVLAKNTAHATAKGRLALLRGVIWAEEGNYSKAGTAFRYAKKQKSTRKAATYNMARLYEKAKYTEKAKGFYKEYLKKYPKGPWAEAAKRALDRL